MEHLLFFLVPMVRLLPYPLNFISFTSLGLATARSSQRLTAFGLTIAGLALTDICLGIHATQPYVYLSFLIIATIASFGKRLIRSLPPIGSLVAMGLILPIIGATVFFLVVNLGVWIHSGMYPHTAAGLARALTLALPFWKSMLIKEIAITACFTLALSRFADSSTISHQEGSFL